ncbi:MAG: hypothetical protein DHS20C05_06590 [Hyphococcus sp.]|nr:MAG: hypothetical protein DHS20C05_06590 [Marinicaulis sp.]
MEPKIWRHVGAILTGAAFEKIKQSHALRFQTGELPLSPQRNLDQCHKLGTCNSYRVF